MKPDLTTFIAACPADIRSHFQEQTYSFHDKLMEQNKKSDCIYILLSGIVKNYHSEINGRKDITTETFYRGHFAVSYGECQC